MERNRAIDEARSNIAQQGYDEALSNVRATRQELKDSVAPYNDAITGILEPLGTAGLHPIAKKLIEKAVKKGSKTVVKAASTAVDDLSAGRNPLARVPSLDEVRGRVSGLSDDLEGNLSERGQSILGAARRVAGKAPLSKSAPVDDSPPPARPTPESGDNLVPQTAEEGNLSTPKPAPADEPLPTAEPTSVNLADEGPVANEDLVDAVASGRMDISTALFKHQMRSGDVPTAASRRAGQPADAEAQQSRFQSRVKQLGNDPAGSESADAAQPASDGSPNVPEAPKADTSTSSTDPAPEAPKPPVEAPTEESALLTDAGEAEAGGGGPEDPFADIIAGVLSLGAIIAGATAKVKPPKYNPGVVNPSVQYGI